MPKAGPTHSLTDSVGNFRLSVPVSDTFRHWNNVDEAPQLRRDQSDGDWEAKTKLSLVAYTSGANFHTGLLVYFSQYDAYYWGPYQGKNLRLE